MSILAIRFVSGLLSTFGSCRSCFYGPYLNVSLMYGTYILYNHLVQLDPTPPPPPAPDGTPGNPRRPGSSQAVRAGGWGLYSGAGGAGGPQAN